MTDPRDPGTGDGHRRARGPFAALEGLDEVQRQALEAAMRVAGELTTLGGDLAGTAWFGDARAAAPTDGTAPNGSAEGRVDVGRLRSDVMRAAETFSDLMRALLDVGFDAMSELARRPVPRPLGASAPGGVARLSCNVHNDGSQPARRVAAHVQQLVADDGALLAADVTVRPGHVDLEPHERAVIEVDVAIPADAQPGRYHGLLLVAGLPDVAHAITVDVTDEATTGDDG